MYYLRALIGALLLAGTLSADQIYTWVSPPSEFGTEANVTPLYDGIIEIPAAYAEPTIEYNGVTYDVDVANYSSPSQGLEEFYVLTVAPDRPISGVPEPALLPAVGAALVGIAAIRKRKPRR
jgi:hypothetical protein